MTHVSCIKVYDMCNARQQVDSYIIHHTSIYKAASRFCIDGRALTFEEALLHHDDLDVCLTSRCVSYVLMCVLHLKKLSYIKDDLDVCLTSRCVCLTSKSSLTFRHTSSYIKIISKKKTHILLHQDYKTHILLHKDYKTNILLHQDYVLHFTNVACLLYIVINCIF